MPRESVREGHATWGLTPHPPAVSIHGGGQALCDCVQGSSEPGAAEPPGVENRKAAIFHSRYLATWKWPAERTLRGYLGCKISSTATDPLWTQKRVAECLGVRQQLVSEWFTTNTENGNTHKPKPDARVKLTPAAKEAVVEQVESGQSQSQVAANFGVTQKAISNVIRANLTRRNLSPDQRREVTKTQKKIAQRLRNSDAKKWTQKRVAECLGVDRTTVAKWFTTNVNGHNTHKTQPDARVKLTPAAKDAVVEQVKSGQSQAQVAANFGVNQSTISNVIRSADKTHSRDDDKARKTAKLKASLFEAVRQG